MIGDHLDFLYTLPGPLPAGAYTVQVNSDLGYGNGSVLEAELGDVSDAGAVTILDTESFTLDVDAGEESGLLINMTRSLPAVPALCGDTLRLRVSVPSGPDGGFFAGIQPDLAIP